MVICILYINYIIVCILNENMIYFGIGTYKDIYNYGIYKLVLEWFSDILKKQLI